MLYFILIVFACSREWQIFIHISSHNNRSGGGITNPRESFTNLHHLRQWARFLLFFVGEGGRKNLNKNGKLRKVAKKLLFLWMWKAAYDDDFLFRRKSKTQMGRRNAESVLFSRSPLVESASFSPCRVLFLLASFVDVWGMFRKKSS